MDMITEEALPVGSPKVLVVSGVSLCQGRREVVPRPGGLESSTEGASVCYGFLKT